MYFGGGSGVTKLFDQGIDGILSSLASAILKAAISLFSDAASKIDTFDKDGTSVKTIAMQLNWLAVAIAVASLLFAAARMALERRGQAGITALKGLVKMILVGGAASVVLLNLAQEGDKYTNYLYEAGVKEQIKVIADCGTSGGTAFLLIIIGLLLIIAGIIHVILLYIRLGVMVVLSATLPLAAAASMTEWGASWWRKHIAWTVAWLVFKPATGLVIYAGTVMINSTSSNADQQKIAGCGVLLLSAVALPALLRLVVPAAAALGSSDGASGVATAAAGGAGKLATGAIAAGAGRAAQLGAGGGQKSGPSGAPSAAGSGSRGPAGGQGPSGGNGSSGPGGSSGTNGSSSGGSSSGGSSGNRGVRIASGAVRGAAAAVGFVAGAASKSAPAAAQHASHVVSGALPGVHDGDGH
ncbi:hypothetical protein CLV70_106312 [Pseudosporangium ferrugineum]|uniref:TrbL/VirB6 plasmid conjugal transfer protein n=2 Tax=Pseudosporangium ferrugineum TaxID=439699 RepID=A0A2T0S838_9ACTN|nr:hypothetical protein CLV70_106312 [Pseudosporangium ferrugineum]